MLENKNYFSEEIETETETEGEEELEQAEKEEQEEIIGQGEKETKELEMEIKINQLIDQGFDQFKLDLYTDTKADYDLRKERNLSMKKMEDWKLQIKSYGQTCELDLKTGKIYYIRRGEPVEILSDTEGYLTISPEDFALKSSKLYNAFGKMNIINRAISLAKKTSKKEFYLAKHSDTGVKGIKVDGKRVISVKGFKKWFGKDADPQAILNMLNIKEEQEENIGQGEKETKESKMEIKINQLIDQRFDQFKSDLYTDTKELPDLRNQRYLSMEKMKDRKLQIKSYGQTCELDLKTGKIYYMKRGKPVEILSDTEGYLTISPEDFALKSSKLYNAFGKMNIINRAMSLANKTDKKDFYLARYPNTGRGIKVDGKRVISVKGFKKWFGKDADPQAILDMLNRIVLL